MALARRLVLMFMLATLLPLFVAAQEEDVLRSTIRADILSDPRSAEMSQAEIDTLVNALATQAEAQGVAQDYLESQSGFDYAVEPPPYKPASNYGALSLAILALAVALAGLVIFLVSQRNMRKRMPPSAGMVA